VQARRIEGTTKSGRSPTISIDSDTVQVLRDHRKRRAEERLRLGPEWRGTGDYVFSIALGRADPPRHGVIAYDHAHVISDQLTWAADIFAQAVAATS